ncbi:TRAP transporter small permease subunit [Chelativorans sp. AA-79]|uniref:TRAP transporter small permease n=1 Tax=Chelativorans sp. AA-79 TaxID=3028735 RepID=UPI0023F9FCA4|nr:TRAP transporter small permease subunit [Chelativorans sp. AA-79]WEX12223.1 TRAP transporter small permease subunit [Chelativorans sp. AA-79]
MAPKHRSADMPAPLRLVHRILLGLAGAVLVVMMLHICVEAVVRLVSPSTTLHTLVIVSTWYMIFLTFLPLPYVGDVHGYMCVELIDQVVKGLARHLLRSVVFVLSAVYFSILAYLTFEDALEQMQVGKVMETATTYLPIWPPVWALPLALGLMAICEVILLVRTTREPSAGKGARAGG